MHHISKRRRVSVVYRVITSWLLLSFSFTSILPSAQAQTIASILPPVGSLVNPTANFTPVLLKGISIDPTQPLNFDFILDNGNTKLINDELHDESQKLIKYFLAALTVPKNDLWVNLSPHEGNRVVPEALSRTALGRDMLAQDYILKQLTASMLNPKENLGEKFWSRIKKRIYEEYGTNELPTNTFNKVWVLPERATVYEHENTVYITDAYLKIMLDSDYSDRKTEESNQLDTLHHSQDTVKEILREIILPEIEKEVNQGKNFAPLRQIFYSLILAKWYKETVENQILDQLYINQNKTNGIEIDDLEAKEKIYKQYIEAFKVGVYDFIQEDYDPVTEDIVAHKYVSGGVVGDVTVDRAMYIPGSINPTGQHFKVNSSINPANDQAMLGGPWTSNGAIEVLDQLKTQPAHKIARAIEILGKPDISSENITRVLNVFYLDNIQLKQTAAVILGQALRNQGAAGPIIMRVGYAQTAAGQAILTASQDRKELFALIKKVLWRERYLENPRANPNYYQALSIALENIFGSNYIEPVANSVIDDDYLQNMLAFENAVANDQAMFGGPWTVSGAREIIRSIDTSKSKKIERSIMMLAANSTATEDGHWILHTFFLNNMRLRKIAALSLARMLEGQGHPKVTISRQSFLNTPQGQLFMEEQRDREILLHSVRQALWREMVLSEDLNDSHYEQILSNTIESIFGPRSTSPLPETLFDEDYYHYLEKYKDAPANDPAMASINENRREFLKRLTAVAATAVALAPAELAAQSQQTTEQTIKPFDVLENHAYEKDETIQRAMDVISQRITTKEQKYLVGMKFIYTRNKNIAFWAANLLIESEDKRVIILLYENIKRIHVSEEQREIILDLINQFDYAWYHRQNTPEKLLIIGGGAFAGISVLSVLVIPIIDWFGSYNRTNRNRWDLKKMARQNATLTDASTYVNHLNSDHHPTRRQAQLAFKKLRIAPEIRDDILFAAVVSPREDTVLWAIDQLLESPDENTAAVLIRALSRNSADIVEKTNTAIASLSLSRDQLVSAYISALENTANFTLVRTVEYAIDYLLEANATEAVSTIAVYMGHSDSDIRKKARTALTQLNAPIDLVVSANIDVLNSNFTNRSGNRYYIDTDAIDESIEHLVELKDQNGAAAITQYLAYPNDSVRKHTRSALKALNTPRDLLVTANRNVLTTSLTDKSEYFNQIEEAIAHLSQLKAKEAVEDIVPFLDSAFSDQRTEAQSALVEILSDSPRELYSIALKYSNNSRRDHTRKWAIEILGQIGIQDAVEPLFRLLDNSQFVAQINDALTKLNAPVERLIEKNIKLLKLKDDDELQAAVNYLKSKNSSKVRDALANEMEIRERDALKTQILHIQYSAFNILSDALHTLGDSRGQIYYKYTEPRTETRIDDDPYWGGPYKVEVAPGYWTEKRRSLTDQAMTSPAGNNRFADPIEANPYSIVPFQSAYIKGRVELSKVADVRLKEFFNFLKEHGLEDDIIIFGGAVRDAITGERINDLDFTTKVNLDGDDPRFIHPNGSNFSAVSEEDYQKSMAILERLAEALEVNVADIVQYKESVEFNGLHLHFHGPRKSVNQDINIRGIVFDKRTNKLSYSTTTPELLLMGIDAQGELINHERGLSHLLNQLAVLAGDTSDGKNLSELSILKLLRVRHQFGLALSNADYALIIRHLNQIERTDSPVLQKEIQKILTVAYNPKLAAEEIRSLGFFVSDQAMLGEMSRRKFLGLAGATALSLATGKKADARSNQASDARKTAIEKQVLILHSPYAYSPNDQEAVLKEAMDTLSGLNLSDEEKYEIGKEFFRSIRKNIALWATNLLITSKDKRASQFLYENKDDIRISPEQKTLVKEALDQIDYKWFRLKPFWAQAAMMGGAALAVAAAAAFVMHDLVIVRENKRNRVDPIKKIQDLIDNEVPLDLGYMDYLNSYDFITRKKAQESFSQLDGDAQTKSDILEKALDSDHKDTALWALLTILASSSIKKIEYVIYARSSKHKEVRTRANEASIELKITKDQQIAAYISLLKKEDDYPSSLFFINATDYLIQENATSAIAAVAYYFGVTEDKIRAKARSTLKALNASNEEMFAANVAVLSKDFTNIHYLYSQPVIENALLHLATLNPVSAIDAVSPFLEHVNKRIREYSQKALSAIDSGDIETLYPIAIAHIRSQYDDTRSFAVQTLRNINNPDATENLIEALADGKNVSAINATLIGFGVPARRIVETNIAALPAAKEDDLIAVVDYLSGSRSPRVPAILADELPKRKDAEYNTISDALNAIGDLRGSKHYVFTPPVTEEVEDLYYDGTGLGTYHTVEIIPGYWTLTERDADQAMLGKINRREFLGLAGATALTLAAGTKAGAQSEQIITERERIIREQVAILLDTETYLEQGKESVLNDTMIYLLQMGLSNQENLQVGLQLIDSEYEPVSILGINLLAESNNVEAVPTLFFKLTSGNSTDNQVVAIQKALKQIQYKWYELFKTSEVLIGSGVIGALLSVGIIRAIFVYRESTIDRRDLKRMAKNNMSIDLSYFRYINDYESSTRKQARKTFDQLSIEPNLRLELLTRSLVSDHQDVALWAIDKLLENPDENTSATLIWALTNKSEKVHEKATSALESLKTTKDQLALIHIGILKKEPSQENYSLGLPKAIRNAIDYLAQAGDQRAITPIAVHFGNSDNETRAKARNALTQLKASNETVIAANVAVLSKNIKSYGHFEVNEALDHLAQLKASSAIEDITPYLEHTDYGVRKKVQEALTAITADAVELLYPIAISHIRSENDDTKSWTIQALGEARNPEAIESLFELLKEGKHVTLINESLIDLNAPTTRLITENIALLSGTDLDNLKGAVDYLINRRDPRVPQALAAELAKRENAEYNVLSDALHALGDPRGNKHYVFTPPVTAEVEDLDPYGTPMGSFHTVTLERGYWTFMDRSADQAMTADMPMPRREFLQLTAGLTVTALSGQVSAANGDDAPAISRAQNIEEQTTIIYNRYVYHTQRRRDIPAKAFETLLSLNLTDDEKIQVGQRLIKSYDSYVVFWGIQLMAETRREEAFAFLREALTSGKYQEYTVAAIKSALSEYEQNMGVSENDPDKEVIDRNYEGLVKYTIGEKGLHEDGFRFAKRLAEYGPKSIKASPYLEVLIQRNSTNFYMYQYSVPFLNALEDIDPENINLRNYQNQIARSRLQWLGQKVENNPVLSAIGGVAALGVLGTSVYLSVKALNSGAHFLINRESWYVSQIKKLKDQLEKTPVTYTQTEPEWEDMFVDGRTVKPDRESIHPNPKYDELRTKLRKYETALAKIRGETDQAMMGEDMSRREFLVSSAAVIGAATLPNKTIAEDIHEQNARKVARGRSIEIQTNILIDRQEYISRGQKDAPDKAIEILGLLKLTDEEKLQVGERLLTSSDPYSVFWSTQLMTQTRGIMSLEILQRAAESGIYTGIKLAIIESAIIAIEYNKDLKALDSDRKLLDEHFQVLALYAMGENGSFEMAIESAKVLATLGTKAKKAAPFLIILINQNPTPGNLVNEDEILFLDALNKIAPDRAFSLFKPMRSPNFKPYKSVEAPTHPGLISKYPIISTLIGTGILVIGTLSLIKIKKYNRNKLEEFERRQAENERLEAERMKRVESARSILRNHTSHSEEEIAAAISTLGSRTTYEDSVIIKNLGYIEWEYVTGYIENDQPNMDGSSSGGREIDGWYTDFHEYYNSALKDDRYSHYKVHYSAWFKVDVDPNDPAMTSDVGGIDFNDIDVKRTGKRIHIDIDPAQLAPMLDVPVEGFVPVIINITPLTNILPLLGLDDSQQLQDTSELSSLSPFRLNNGININQVYREETFC